MSDESRIRELSELIRNKCLQARQQQQQAGGQSAPATVQVGRVGKEDNYYTFCVFLFNNRIRVLKYFRG